MLDFSCGYSRVKTLLFEPANQLPWLKNDLELSNVDCKQEYDTVFIFLPAMSFCFMWFSFRCVFGGVRIHLSSTANETESAFVVLIELHSEFENNQPGKMIHP